MWRDTRIKLLALLKQRLANAPAQTRSGIASLCTALVYRGLQPIPVQDASSSTDSDDMDTPSFAAVAVPFQEVCHFPDTQASGGLAHTSTPPAGQNPTIVHPHTQLENILQRDYSVGEGTKLEDLLEAEGVADVVTIDKELGMVAFSRKANYPEQQRDC